MAGIQTAPIQNESADCAFSRVHLDKLSPTSAETFYQIISFLRASYLVSCFGCSAMIQSRVFNSVIYGLLSCSGTVMLDNSAEKTVPILH